MPSNTVAKSLEDYVDVAERVAAFKAEHPDGCLRAKKDWEVREVGDQTYIVYTALAYRTPDDPMPGEGTAWEPFPGKTPYTRESELMNAETAAWGRAIAALGFEVRRGIATRQDVRNRQGNGSAPAQAPKPPKPEGIDEDTLRRLRGAVAVIDRPHDEVELALVAAGVEEATRVASAICGEEIKRAEATAVLPLLTPEQAEALSAHLEARAAEGTA
jgi:hypothetical protein